MFNFEELNEETRAKMLQEFDTEEAGSPFRSPRLSPLGVQEFPCIMREAIRNGNEQTLYDNLNGSRHWNETEPYVRNGVTRFRRLNYSYAAKTFAVTEFNTWYVRGLCRRLLDDGVDICQVYRAESAQLPRPECHAHNGRRYSVQNIYDGHRAHYWPEPGDNTILSIPVGPLCHHSIRRITDGENSDE